MNLETLTDLIVTFKDCSSVALRYRTDFRTFTYTYKELFSLIRSMSTFLDSKGIKPGDKVLIWGQNSPSWVVAFLGIIYYGAIAVPADMLGTNEAVLVTVKRSRAKLIIKTKYKPSLETEIESFYLEDLLFTLKDVPPALIPYATKPDDIIEIIFTSGTTGDPKGITLTHKNIVSNVLAVCSVINITSNDVMLSTLPLSHMFEQTAGLFVPMYRKSRITYITSLKQSALFSAIKEENITAILTVPRIIEGIRDGILAKVASENRTNIFNYFCTLGKHYPWLKKILFRSIWKRFGPHFRFFVSGGAPLNPEIEEFWKLLGFTILQGYGLTECSPVLTVNNEDVYNPGSVGKALPNVEIRIAEDGEILAKGPNIFPGYWEDKEKYRAAFREGWFLTGDIGSIDDKGYLSIKARKKDVIVTASGVNVYPEDIERLLIKMNGVHECAIVGIPGVHGEEVHAVFVFDAKISVNQIVADINKQLDTAQQIMSWTVWEGELPKTSTLKIKKAFLVKEIIRRSDSNVQETSIAISRISTLLKRITGVKNINPEMLLVRDLKIDSLGRVELVTAIEQEYNFDFSEELINSDTTVDDVERIVKERIRISSRYTYPRWSDSFIVRFLGVMWLELINLSLWRPFCYLKVRGVKNLSQIKNPVIFVSNHVSYADHACIIRALPFRFRYVTNTPAWGEFFFPEESTKLKLIIRRIFYYYCITTLRIFMMFERHSFSAGMKHAGKIVDKGESILIFPEGGHTRNNEMLPFKNGTATLIQELKIPVIPIGLHGLESLYPHDATFPKPGKVTVSFGKPINFTTESIQEITDRLSGEIEILRKGI